jgi:hypothetical protein
MYPREVVLTEKSTMNDYVPSRLETALTHRHRRVILEYLRSRDSVSLTDLTHYLIDEVRTDQSRVITSNNEKNLRTRLLHIDIPLLADFRLLEYNVDTQIITSRPAMDRLNLTHQRIDDSDDSCAGR